MKATTSTDSYQCGNCCSCFSPHQLEQANEANLWLMECDLCGHKEVRSSYWDDFNECPECSHTTLTKTEKVCHNDCPVCGVGTLEQQDK